MFKKKEKIIQNCFATISQVNFIKQKSTSQNSLKKRELRDVLLQSR